jgi:preprotein translocase subunit SecG
MGGLAGLGGMTSQSAFSTAGAATFIQKLTRVVAVIFFIVVFALGLITAKQDQTVEESAMQKATRESAAEQAVPEVPALPATFNAPAEVAPAAPAAEVKAEAPAAPAAEVKAEAAPAPEAAAPAEAPKAKKGKKKAK